MSNICGGCGCWVLDVSSGGHIGGVGVGEFGAAVVAGAGTVGTAGAALGAVGFGVSLAVRVGARCRDWFEGFVFCEGAGVGMVDWEEACDGVCGLDGCTVDVIEGF